MPIRGLTRESARIDELLMCLQFRRRRGRDGHCFASHGMRELEPLGVQEISAVSGQPRLMLDAATRVVERIANQRVTCVSQVNPDLVRASGRDVDAEKRLIVPMLEHDRDAM